MITLEKLTIALVGVLMLGTTGAANAATVFSAPAAGDSAGVLVAQEEGEGLQAGDSIMIDDGGEEWFAEDAAYEVQEDTEGELFVEDEEGETWNITSVSEDGDEVQLEFDGRTVEADDVDS